MSADSQAALSHAIAPVYILGIDGSGKSTVAEFVEQYYVDRGCQAETIWLRYNNLLSKPLLGLCRLLGLTQYEQVDGHKIGYHHFYRSKLVSVLFVFFQYLDALRVRYQVLSPRLSKSGRALILDRYVYDILVDIMVDTHFWQLLENSTGDRFKQLLPEGTKVLLIRRPWEAILEVRPEGVRDRFFKSRFDQFERIAATGEVEVIDNNGTLDELLDKVQAVVADDKQFSSTAQVTG